MALDKDLTHQKVILFKDIAKIHWFVIQEIAVGKFGVIYSEYDSFNCSA